MFEPLRALDVDLLDFVHEVFNYLQVIGYFLRVDYSKYFLTVTLIKQHKCMHSIEIRMKRLYPWVRKKESHNHQMGSVKFNFEM